MLIELVVNGIRRLAQDVWPGESLLYLLRERLALPGTKNACEQGECGSCSLYLDDRLVCACLVPAPQAHGRQVTTIEGLDDRALQQAFLDAGAVQCGFCTPGMVMATHCLLREKSEPSDADIREALSGNLCRCTGYETILDAVRRADAERSGAAG